MKNGRHRSGTQRWRCKDCGSSTVRRRPDVRRREQLHRFLIWLTGKSTQAEAGGGTGRSFRDQTAWCWDLQPQMPVTGEVHDAVLVDGIWIGSWCLLIALSDTGHVIAWQWAARESTAAWEALFGQFPPPEVVVTDGGSGIRSALANTWPDTAVQRCLFHLQMNVTRELTRNPRLKAGRALRALAMNLSTVTHVDTAIQWRLALEGWWQRFGHLTKERTFYEHRRRAVEWFLLLREVPLERAHQHAHVPEPTAPQAVEEHLGPELYGTGLDAAEGLWHRSGWIGEH